MVRFAYVSAGPKSPIGVTRYRPPFPTPSHEHMNALAKTKHSADTIPYALNPWAHPIGEGR